MGKESKVRMEMLYKTFVECVGLGLKTELRYENGVLRLYCPTAPAAKVSGSAFIGMAMINKEKANV